MPVADCILCLLLMTFLFEIGGGHEFWPSTDVEQEFLFLYLDNRLIGIADI